MVLDDFYHYFFFFSIIIIFVFNFNFLPPFFAFFSQENHVWLKSSCRFSGLVVGAMLHTEPLIEHKRWKKGRVLVYDLPLSS